MTTTPNKMQRIIQAHEDMVSIVQAWNSTPDKVLILPVASRGEGVNVRQLFYMWRSEMVKMYNDDPWVRIATNITVRNPYEASPGQWFLGFIETNQGIKSALKSLGFTATPTSPPPIASHEEPTESPPHSADDANSLVQRWLRGELDFDGNPERKPDDKKP